MRQWRSWLFRLASTFGAGRANAEIVEELHAHRELLAAEYVRSGMTPDEARRRAGTEFGSVAAVADVYQDRRGIPALEVAIRDGRFAMRSIARTPMLSLSMVIVLGLGIGVSTAIVAVFHAMAWADLPVPEAKAVVRINQRVDGVVDPRVQGEVSRFSYPDFETYRQSTRVFSALTALSQTREMWRIQADVRPLQTAHVTADYFRVLPVVPALGRTLTADDADTPVVVVSYRLWSGAFGAVRDVVGRTMLLDQEAYTIVGVAPQSFAGTELDSVDAWVPLKAMSAPAGGQDVGAGRNRRWLQVFGRLAPSASTAAARAEAALVAEQLQRESGFGTAIGITRASRLDVSFERRAMNVGIVAVAVVGLLFLICASNAAALLLAKGASRQREIGVRVALGADRIHIVRQLLAEVGMIALASAGVGVVVCLAALQAFASSFPIPDLLSNIRPDMNMFGYALTAALVVAVVFGLAPLRQALQVDCLSSLKEESTPSSTHPSGLRLRRALIAFQVTASAVLLVVASVMGRAVSHALETDPGYATEGLYVVELDPTWEPGERPADTGRLASQVVSALVGAPGIRGLSQVTLAPFSGIGTSRASSDPGAPLEPVNFNEIDPSYFEALGVPLVAGRSFLPNESDSVILNAALARRFWSDERSAIGETLFIPSGRRANRQFRPLRVIGVAPTLQTGRIGFSDDPTYYTLLTEEAARRAFLLVRAGAGTRVQQLVVNSARPAGVEALPRVTGVDAQLTAKTATTRLAVAIVGFVGILSLMVAAVGIYALVSFIIAGRLREIGVYQAVGASEVQVLRLLLGWTLRGVIFGAAGALAVMLTVGAAVGAQLKEKLYGMHPVDAPSFITSVSLLALVVGLATYLSARRALGVAPIAALRGNA